MKCIDWDYSSISSCRSFIIRPVADFRVAKRFLKIKEQGELLSFVFENANAFCIRRCNLRLIFFNDSF